MKLSEIRPCDNCGGKIGPQFYVIRMSIAFFKPGATREVLGMTQYFGGALELAELMTPDPEAVIVAMDDKDGKELMIELFLCQDCHMREVNLTMLAEKRNEALAEAQRAMDELDGRESGE